MAAGSENAVLMSKLVLPGPDWQRVKNPNTLTVTQLLKLHGLQLHFSLMTDAKGISVSGTHYHS